MGNLDSRGDLAVVEIAFYGIAILFSVAVCLKQGFSKNLGWLYLVLLSIFRLIGASCILYMETQQDYSSGLQETAAITSAIGTTPLLLALLGFLQRINGNMTSKDIPLNVFRPVHLIAIVALIIGIVGGVKESGSDPNDYSTGKDCMEGAAILYLFVWLALAGLAILTGTRSTYVPSTESKLLIAGLCAIPFLLVRVIYTVASAFSSPGSTFYFRSPNVYVQAFMMFLMEAIVVSLYIVAGLLTPKQVSVASTSAGYVGGQKDVEMARRSDGGASMQTTDYAADPVHAEPTRHHQRPQRSIGDYRPSRLIRDAINERR